MSGKSPPTTVSRGGQVFLLFVIVCGWWVILSWESDRSYAMFDARIESSFLTLTQSIKISPPPPPHSRPERESCTCGSETKRITLTTDFCFVCLYSIRYDSYFPQSINQYFLSIRPPDRVVYTTKEEKWGCQENSSRHRSFVRSKRKNDNDENWVRDSLSCPSIV